MTPGEHARVWRKAATSMPTRKDAAIQAAWVLADAVATAYEQSAKEQEGRDS